MIPKSHSVPPPLSAGAVEPPTKFSKSGGLTGPHLLEGVAAREEGDFFQRGGLQFSYKKSIKI